MRSLELVPRCLLEPLVWWVFLPSGCLELLWEQTRQWAIGTQEWHLALSTWVC